VIVAFGMTSQSHDVVISANQAARPPGVEDVQLDGFLARIERRNQWTDDALDQPPADRSPLDLYAENFIV